MRRVQALSTSQKDLRFLWLAYPPNRSSSHQFGGGVRTLRRLTAFILAFTLAATEGL
jgi:hypothetical protein